MNWRNPDVECPLRGDIIAVLSQHNKEHVPLSCEIGFYEVWGDGTEHPEAKWYVINNDYIGMGSSTVSFDKEDYSHCNVVLAWMPAKEFPIPAWIPHDKHWGTGYQKTGLTPTPTCFNPTQCRPIFMRCRRKHSVKFPKKRKSAFSAARFASRKSVLTILIK